MEKENSPGLLRSLRKKAGRQPFIPKLPQISHSQFSVAVMQEDEESIWWRTHRQPPVLAQDNQDKWSVIRRSLKRGHSYELPEPAVSKIDFQLRGFEIPLRLLRPLQSLDSLWTQRGRR
ncbi:hypothetical protein EAG_14613 [Camponotus floridanus]|uniref:Uncharacterized protein n=1 Tax=Camponotus floridanus TaxID=104421 RepID=E1ZXQ7_CAMFO|nr:hypothetical protein EAG_14613 [Camponotus floridanus]